MANGLFIVARTAGEVCSGVVNKCLNQRVKTKDLGMAILMMYIEIEKQDIVQVIIVSDVWQAKTHCGHSSSSWMGLMWSRFCFSDKNALLKCHSGK